jgi:outer membrane protein OmpA-like peptidoglycan-associated protein/tetratricopeptide (TPR) repeat protein
MPQALIRFTLICIALFFSACLSQQNALEMANTAYKLEKYYVAIPLYKKLSNSSMVEQRIEVNLQIANCYQKMGNHKEAVQWFQRSIDFGNENAQVFLQCGKSHLALEQYNEARDQFLTYYRKTRDSIPLVNLDRTLEWTKKQAYFEIYNESTLNTKHADFTAHTFGDGLIFTSNRNPIKNNNYFEYNGKAYSDIFTVKKVKNKWEKPEEIKSISTAFNEGVSSYCEQTGILYYTQCNGNRGNSKTCRIYQTEFDGVKFSKDQAIDIRIDSAINFGNPSISKDGKTLYYTSDMSGGFGQNDLYVSYFDGKSWSAPQNLGDSINTPYDEDFSFIHPDGTLYFASEGHPGMGGFDLFYSKKDSITGLFASPENLRYPTNSTSDDFSVFLNEDKDEGYISSTRLGGKGEEDIYTIFVSPPVVVLQGRAYNAITQKVLRETNISLKVNKDGKTQSLVTDKLGFYSLKLEVDQEYSMNAQKNGYFGDNASLNTLGIKISDTLKQDFYLTPFPKTIVLKGIYYDLNSADLRPESFPILDTLLNTLRENLNMVVELSSHTDARADDEYNLDLSQRRAQSVVNYLVEKGIPIDRLVPKGYGETRLVNKCADGVECTEEEHQQNRRTEFRVLREDYKSN